jgi:antitoxin (DNA-binding transcriptional repressor) of toxin-antitoxin stability system
MTIVTIEEAQAKLPELIEHLAAGEELVIIRCRWAGSHSSSAGY